MNIEELREYCLSVKGASESFPFAKFARGAENILVFKVMGKMFAYVDIFPADGVFLVWMKCDPQRSAKLRQEYEGIFASVRNLNRNWNGVALESDVPGTLVRELILHSVEEVIKGLPRKKREEYQNM